MDAMERGGSEELILKAALECLGNEAELSNLQPAEFERMATTIVEAIPERWAEISALYPRLKKRAQNAIVQALFKRKPPVRDQEVYRTLALHSQQLDPHYRAALLGRLARLGDTAEAGRLLIHLLQDYNEGAMRPGPLSRISVNDCVTLYNLLIERSAELMLFPKAVLRITLDWNVRLQSEPIEKRRLVGLMARMLAKMKWRDIGDELLGPYLNAFVNMSEAGSITLSPEWPMLFKLILKQLRHRPTDQDILLALGKLIRSGPAAEEPAAVLAAKRKPVESPKVVYDPHSGVGWANQTIYPPHVAKQAFISRIPGLAPESFVADQPESEDSSDNAEDHVTAETAEPDVTEALTESVISEDAAEETEADTMEAVNAADEPPALSDEEENADESKSDDDASESKSGDNADTGEDEEEPEADTDEDEDEEVDERDHEDEGDTEEAEDEEEVKATRQTLPSPAWPAPASAPIAPTPVRPQPVRPQPLEPRKVVAPAIATLTPAKPENGNGKSKEEGMELAQIVRRLDQLEAMFESGLSAVRELQAQMRRMKA